ncbi:PAS domain-containing hybrid sensor histidine kinase/response regulator [Parendozoicomonas sp. Alg238-R29]|uniref:hybrid sensor histidine kinase/response regulator n=1 Tax=Parendozoicomonas sp. Alg238-R29 TaxID=2993446 RepID=UPI00248DE40E|nr:PAS domain-containing hybrid sensor histidine kinase/response regulator [Parendozoicomonas sp. Alg238-R29]
MNGWLIILVSLIYAGGLFAVAWYGDNHDRFRKGRWQPLVYSLTLAVYCTSWTFFGAVGQAAISPWSFIPIYLAPIVVMLFMWRLQARMILIGKQENITSIADFLAARYGRSRLVAVVATVVAAFGVIPYIALQLKAILMGYSLLSADQLYFFGGATASQIVSGDTALLVTFALAGFSILFGTRHLDTTEHHHGVMLAVAVESILKLLAFLAVGVFVIWQAPQGWTGLISETQTLSAPENSDWFSLSVMTLISMAAYFCLPRQFHVTVVENTDVKHFQTARKIFPVYLLLMCLFVLPVSMLGKQILAPGVSPDTFVISLPMGMGYFSLAVLAYIGGVSAAIGMVIVSVIALAIMLGNEVIVPLLLKGKRLPDSSFKELRGLLLNIRRGLIVAILLLAWGFSRIIDGQSLAALGFMSFTALAQLAPGLIGGLVWRNSNRNGVVFGIFAGGLSWLVLLVLPAAGLELPIISTLKTVAPDNVQEAGMLMSLLVNVVCYWFGSLFFVPRLQERHQAGRFMDVRALGQSDLPVSNVRVDELEQLAARFVGEDKAREAFEAQAGEEQTWMFRQRKASPILLAMTERLLSSVLGASSARIVMRSALDGHRMDLTDVESIVDEASSVLTFNRELLQSSIENIEQGLSVIDQDLRLVAWNQQYLEMFDYPEGLVCIGRHISELIRFNAERGLCGPGSIEEHVRKRVKWMQSGTAHRSERTYNNGTVIQIQGNPMPGGGFVMSFTDITSFRGVENQLKAVNEELELRVQERTQELEVLNQDLLKAKQQAEQANGARSRFFAAISHDLMQPMHAARLFTATLVDEFREGRVGELAGQLDSSLQSAEDLLKDLQELSRLETGRVSRHIESFSIDDLLQPLKNEYGVMADKYQVTFRLVGNARVVKSDRTLLRRVLQNFLANAFRYAKGGTVLLVCRRSGGGLRIEVRDNGPGIPAQQQESAFRAFQRLDHSDAQGLGLGLAIARGIAGVLNHELGLHSVPGQGSVFHITVPTSEISPRLVRSVTPFVASNKLAGVHVFCIDNDPMILEGQKALLQRWGCYVETATNRNEVLQKLESFKPDIILADYHLDDGAKGLDCVYAIRDQMEYELPAIIISADASPQLKAQLRSEELGFMPKPVKPATLRAYMSRFMELERP